MDKSLHQAEKNNIQMEFSYREMVYLPLHHAIKEVIIFQNFRLNMQHLKE